MRQSLFAVLLLSSVACGPGPAGVQAETASIVDASTLNGKLIVGYQGWFATPGDGSRLGWSHWAPGVAPNADDVTFDVWPDTTELGDDELADTDLRFADQRHARLFSAYREKTVRRHFEWMQQYGIDGALLQRFVSELSSPPHKDHRDTVTRNVRAGAERSGRIFGIEYDISGANDATFDDELMRDWRSLVDDMGITQSAQYMRHNGLPVVAVWGLGFTDRPGTVDQANRIIDFFQNGPAQYRATLIGGVPLDWNRGASNLKPGFRDVYPRFDILNPWSVGGYATDADIDGHIRDRVRPDLSTVHGWGKEYMPVVFPGFSWTNLTHHRDPLNYIPRRGGDFYWKQLYELKRAGCSMIFGAMFDEVDEGTAILKAASRRGDAPDGSFLTLDADGRVLPSDWYLQLAGQGTRMLRGEIPPTAQIPISPNVPSDPTPAPNPTPTPQPQPMDRSAIIVEHGYLGILGRDVDPSGAMSFGDSLRSGMSVTDFCRALFASAEFAQNRASLSPQDLATSLYRGILGRDPDPSGLDTTVNAIEQGRAAERAADMLQSAEFQTSNP